MVDWGVFELLSQKASVVSAETMERFRNSKEEFVTKGPAPASVDWGMFELIQVELRIPSSEVKARFCGASTVSVKPIAVCSSAFVEGACTPLFRDEIDNMFEDEEIRLRLNERLKHMAKEKGVADGQWHIE